MPKSHYRFSATGHPGVKGAFQSIGEAAARSDTQVDALTASLEAYSRAAGRAKSAGAGFGGASRVGGGRAGAGAVGGGSRVSRAKQEQRELVALERKTLGDIKRFDQAKVRSAQKAQREIDASAKKGRAEALRDFRKQEAIQRRVRKRARAEQIRDAKQVARAQERVAQGRRQRFGAAVGGLGGAAIRGVGAIGAATVGIAGIAVRESIQLQDRATRLSIKGGSVISGTALRKGVESTVSQVRGAKAGDILAGMEKFVSKTGRLDLAQNFSKVMAEISVATGTAAEDIGGAMADLFEKFDIESVNGMAKAMAVLAVQGKRGAFELEDAARNFPKIAAAAQRFGLGGVKGLATLGGLTQIARMATPSGEEAATAVEAMFKQLVAKSAQIEKVTGARVFADKGKTKTRDIQDILVETIAGSKGNLVELQKIFDVRGIRAVSPLITTFNQARQGIKGTEAEKTAAGIAALRKQLSGAIDATGALAEIQRDLAAAQSTTSAKLTAAWESLRTAAGDKLAPAVAELAGGFAAFIEGTDFSGLEFAFLAITDAAKMAAEALDLFSEKTPEQEATEKAEKDLAESNAAIGKLGLSGKQLTAAGTAVTLAKNLEGAGASQQAIESAVAPILASAGISPEEFKGLSGLPQLLQTKGAATGVLFKPVGENPFDIQQGKDMVSRANLPREILANIATGGISGSRGAETGNPLEEILTNVLSGGLSALPKALGATDTAPTDAQAKAALAAADGSNKQAKAANRAADTLDRIARSDAKGGMGGIFSGLWGL